MKTRYLILGGVFIDAYNQSVNINIAGTITTRVDASNMNFVTDIMEYKFYQYPRGVNKGGVLNVEICPTISCSSWENNCFLIQTEMEEAKVEQIGNLYPDKDGFKNRTSGRVYSSDGLSPTLRTVTGGHNEPKIVEPIVLGWVRDKQGNVIKRPEVEIANCVTSGKRDNTQNYVVEPTIIKEGNYHKSGHNASSIVNPKGISPTVMENHGTVTATVEPLSCRIRKLTPRECFRLMDCNDEVIDKIQEAGISNSQQYKLAGNSIVVNVLYHLFRKLFIETENEENQLTLF